LARDRFCAPEYEPAPATVVVSSAFAHPARQSRLHCSCLVTVVGDGDSKKRSPHYVTSVITEENGTTLLRLRSLPQPALRQTSAATAAAQRRRCSEVDHRSGPRCPKCHGSRTTIRKNRDGRFYCTVCPGWFRVSAYAKRRRTDHKDRCAGRNMF